MALPEASMLVLCDPTPLCDQDDLPKGKPNSLVVEILPPPLSLSKRGN